MAAKAKITSEGKITIPEEVREALGAKEGDNLVFEVENGAARVRVEKDPMSFANYAGAWREGEGKSMEEIIEEVRWMRGHYD
ncbi:MAG: AbrB/MazE/SpoVT family DNA-binding domain-containing protein [Rubrobacter sp.]|jgi:AbrB family looped-hinge helix DNA binding protein|nr:AbrB/MazE/SpoVT family DNA-binding domain-containing protein [Rubrobacter sp.]